MQNLEGKLHHCIGFPFVGNKTCNLLDQHLQLHNKYQVRSLSNEKNTSPNFQFGPKLPGSKFHFLASSFDFGNAKFINGDMKQPVTPGYLKWISELSTEPQKIFYKEYFSVKN